MHKSIGYHTRLYGKNTTKVCGGSFGGSFDLETANRLVKHHFKVIAKSSGTLVFVDDKGREVTLYITVDPEATEAGKLAREEFRRLQALKQQEDGYKREQLEDLLNGMSVEEAISRLMKVNLLP